jgi:iron(III) transport system substrate-binding protein
MHKRAVALAALLALGAAAPPAADMPKATPSVEQMAGYTGPDRDQKLLAAAKAEGGELSVYHVYPALTKVIAAFSKKYGIEVKPWRSSSEAVLQRVVNEARGSRFDADVVQNNAPENEAAWREKLLMPVRSPLQAELIPEATPPHHAWVGFTIDVFIAAYNPQKLGKEELPTSYEQLLDPKWKGKLGVEADDSGWYGALADLMGEQKTNRLFAQIIQKNGMSIRKGHSLLANLVASGEIPLALDTYSWSTPQLKKKGGPIEIHAIEPVLAQFSTIAVLKHAKHPYTALLFYDYLLGEGQKVLDELDFVPTSLKYDDPVRHLKLHFIDPSKAIANEDKWFKQYQSVVVAPSK